MKKDLLFIFAAIMVAVSCGKNPDTNTEFVERKDIVLTKSQGEILQSSNAFAFTLLKELYGLEESQELFFSPLSVSAVFSMLANGAGGETLSQIAASLGLKGFSSDEINGTYKTLIEALLSADNSTKISLANAMWLNSDLGFKVLPAFSSALGTWYNAPATDMSFSSPSALSTVNNWAKDNTNGLIPKILDRIEPDWSFILANALYFKGVWSRKFEKSWTRPENFHCLTGGTRQMDFMHGDIPCKYYYNQDIKAGLCELPFGNKAFALDILLPDDDVDFKAFISKLDARAWNETLSRDNLWSTNEYVIIPKMDIAWSSGVNNLKDALISAGIKDIFNPAKSDLTKLSEINTFIYLIIQKARFKMDEDGAEAAAVTVAVGKEMSAGPSAEFRADHPFVYAIRETSTGAILFLGTFVGR